MLRLSLKEGNSRLSFVFGLGFVALVFVGCMDPDWAKKLDTGTVLPDMRFEIAPEKGLDPKRLYPIFANIARDEGYTEYSAQPIEKQFIRAMEDRPVWTFRWREPDGSKPIHTIAFSRNAYNSNNHEAFTVILYNDGMQDFDIDDWIVYRDWSERILPAAFPNAVVKESNHPAVYTAEKDLEAIAQQTGMPIPEKYLERLSQPTNP